MGLQLFLWGAFSPLFGVITDKYGGNIAIFLGFLFFLLELFYFIPVLIQVYILFILLVF